MEETAEVRAATLGGVRARHGEMPRGGSRFRGRRGRRLRLLPVRSAPISIAMGLMGITC